MCNVAMRTIGSMFSHRSNAAGKVNYLGAYGQRIGVTADCMLQKWCKVTVQIRIELLKHVCECTVTPALLSSSEINQEFANKFDRRGIRIAMEAVCTDLNTHDWHPFSVIENDDELVIALVPQ